jgi:4a-hydroxytetrahydrobiopterin dehydratase
LATNALPPESERAQWTTVTKTTVKKTTVKNMALVGDAEIQAFLEAHPGWEREGEEIIKTYTHADFVSSMGFTTQVALLAEKADHHPDIDIRWNKVTLTFSTHSEGGLTPKDLDLADACDGLVS